MSDRTDSYTYDAGKANDPPDPTAEELREIADRLTAPLLHRNVVRDLSDRLRAIADRIDGAR